MLEERDRPMINLGNDEKIHPSLGQVWWKGKQWAVTSDGIETLRTPMYVIEKDRLLEQFKDRQPFPWPRHMNAKDWVDIDEFTTAWLVALVLHGYEKTWNINELLEIFGRLKPKSAIG